MAILAAILALHVSFTAPTHTPKVNTRWNFKITATLNGKPAKAKLTLQVIDPLGSAHYIQHGTTNKNLHNWPFTGVYRDFAIWPPSSRGIPLVLRATVTASGLKRVVKYTVTPR